MFELHPSDIERRITELERERKRNNEMAGESTPPLDSFGAMVPHLQPQHHFEILIKNQKYILIPREI